MGKSGHTSVSMNQKRFDKMYPKFAKHIQEDNKPSYTEWITTLAENSLDRIIKLKLLFPNLSVVKVLEHGLVIEDSKYDGVAKVVIKGNKITCSIRDDNSSQNYILYASMHPHFPI